MKSFILIALLPALVKNHDKRKCQTAGRADPSCCAKLGLGECLDGYQLTWSDDTPCYIGSWTAYQYFCNKPAAPVPKNVLKNHDPSKCRERHHLDNDCCAVEKDQSCADGYITTWGEVCNAGEYWTARKYYCTEMREPVNHGDDQKDHYDPYKNKERNFELDDMLDDLPEYNPKDDLRDSFDTENIKDYASYYKWSINLFLVAIPWSFTAMLMVGWNLWFNLEWNKWWAQGNLYLVANSVFIIMQALNSLLITAEYPIYLRAFRVTRVFSFFGAIFYTFFYILAFLEWYDMLYIVTDKSHYDFITIFINMFLGYNLVLHSSVIPINLVIIIKEFSLNFYQFFDDEDRAGQTSTYLNTNDLGYAEKDILWFLNPFTWIDVFWEPTFGYDAEDYVIENQNDEEHYYKNWSK